MQTCWNCSAEQFDGTIFCTECGASLIGKQRRKETTAALMEQEAADDTNTNEPHVVAAPEPNETPPGFSLVVINDGRRMALETNKNLIVGRTDQRRGIIPDVDLGNYGGYDAGVSRRHALIAVRDNTCIVEDLGSSNGTYVNSKRAPANQPITLRSGDELKFGTLLLRVELNL